jgi:hypothetical protein
MFWDSSNGELYTFIYIDIHIYTIYTIYIDRYIYIQYIHIYISLLGEVMFWDSSNGV